MSGTVYLVGAGPGDPGLITVRGRELLAHADAIVYDYLAAPRLLEYARPDAKLVYVGKQADRHTLKQEQINDLLVGLAHEHASVVRLKGGDPYVFGRGGEEALALVDAGIEFEVVPGVTAGIAAAAYAGIPVTHRTLASNVGLITGHETPDKPGHDLDYSSLAAWKGTLAFYMSVASLPDICSSLIKHGLDGATPAAAVRWGTTPQQQVITATVATLADTARQADLKPPALIVIGKVVALREKLNWFERRPLFGRRIVVTRARTQASALSDQLRQYGADVVEMPAIRIEPPADTGPLDKAVQELDRFDWVVLTSTNGVDAFFAALARANRDSRALNGCRVCAIGPATAERLRQFGINADAVPAKYVSSEITATLSRVQDLSNAAILYPHADIAPPNLAEALAAAGATVRDVIAYGTVADNAGSEEAAEMLSQNQIHWITFTSSSTVRNFISVVDAELLKSSDVRMASIGPETSATLRQFGLSCHAEADPHTIDALVDAILTAEREDQ